MIDFVEMVNWRAFDERRVDFGPGITFLTGANGSGKTSILEAVIYALTGESATVKDPGQHARLPGRRAGVRVGLTLNRNQYLIERYLSPRHTDEARLVRLADGEVLANTHKRVSEGVEAFSGVSTDFLRRIVTMAEGDVFLFQREPPGKALDMQTRRVLGLKQLDEFVTALTVAEKQLKGLVQELHGVVEQVDRLGLTIAAAGEDRDGADPVRRRLTDELRAVQEEMAGQRREQQDALRLVPLVQAAVPALQKDAEVWRRAQKAPLAALFAQIEMSLAAVQEEVDLRQQNLARLAGERSAHQRVLDLLRSHGEATETTPCPVCRQPMTTETRREVLRAVQGDIDHIQQQGQAAERELTDLRRRRDHVQSLVTGLSELRNALSHGNHPGLGADATIVDVQKATESGRRLYADRLAALEKQAQDIQVKLAEIEGAQGGYAALRGRLQAMGYASSDAARRTLVALEVRALSLRAANRAAQDTLAAQRGEYLRRVYEQLARLWSGFKGEEGWTVGLGKAGEPELRGADGRPFELGQLSGGEKTALLVMLHTVLAHQFSRSDFLMIDEPFEHLDVVNRRSLVRFLLGAYRRGDFRQVIVATCEEAPLRTLAGEDGVSVVWV